MRKNILLAAIILTLQSCGHAGENNTKEEVQIISDSFQKPLSWKNPSLMFGSDFLNVFKRFYINQDYNSLMLLTSNETKRKFGEEKIFEFYKNELKLGFDIKLKSIRCNSDSSVWTLNYEANILATKQIKSINCIIENDTTKINMNNFSIFVNE